MLLAAISKGAKHYVLPLNRGKSTTLSVRTAISSYGLAVPSGRAGLILGSRWSLVVTALLRLDACQADAEFLNRSADPEPYVYASFWACWVVGPFAVLGSVPSVGLKRACGLR